MPKRADLLKLVLNVIRTPPPETAEPQPACRKNSRKSSELTTARFEALLSALDPDRNRAGERYEKLRDRLVLFFERRHCPDAETCADDALDVVAGKLLQEHVERIENYSLTVAGNVFLEKYRHREREPMAHPDVARLADLQYRTGHPNPKAQDDPYEGVDLPAMLDCFQRCFAAIEEHGRNLIIEYYGEAGRRKIERRRGLARFLGLSQSGLRARKFRAKKQLETCFWRCVENNHPATNLQLDH